MALGSLRVMYFSIVSTVNEQLSFCCVGTRNVVSCWHVVSVLYWHSLPQRSGKLTNYIIYYLLYVLIIAHDINAKVFEALCEPVTTIAAAVILNL